VVDEGLHTVDLDDRQARAMTCLELGVGGDVDRDELEAESRCSGLQDTLGVVAEAAVGRAVEHDLDEIGRHGQPVMLNGSTCSLVTAPTEVASMTRR
jgi:hypothetical protein